MDQIELKIKADVYDHDVDPPVLIKKNVTSRITLERSDICCPEEIVNKKGNVLKSFCRIKVHSKDQHLVVNHPYEFIKNIIAEHKPVIGFKVPKHKTHK